MELLIAGGCGDEGRNCFYVEGNRHAFLVDAGTSTDGFERVPELSTEQIRNAQYIFITHSHRDHTGAIEYFERLGFTGQVLMTNQSYRQIHHKPKNTMILDSTAPELELEKDFSLVWGRTGHCAGAVWFTISTEGKKLFFSGDYRENDPFYRADPVRGLTADVAVVDGAYNRDVLGETMRREVLDKAREMISTGNPLLLPAPRYGRGLSMAVSLHREWGNTFPIYLSPKIYEQWKLLGKRRFFVNDWVLQVPEDSFRLWDEETVEKGAIYFLTDAQLAREETRKLVDAHPDLGILLTGSIHGYGKAKGYVESGRAAFVLWPNHQTKREFDFMVSENHFKKVVLFHNRNVKPEANLISF